MLLKKNNLLDCSLSQPQGSVNVNIVVSKVVKDVYSLTMRKKPFMTSQPMKEEKFKCNFTGEKMKNKFKKLLIILKIPIKLTKTKNRKKRKQELAFKIVSNYSNNLKF